MPGRRTRVAAIMAVSAEAGLSRDERVELAGRIADREGTESLSDLNDAEIGYVYFALLHWRMIEQYRLLNGTLSDEAAVIVASEAETGLRVGSEAEVGTETPILGRSKRVGYIRRACSDAGVTRGERMELIRHIIEDHSVESLSDMDDDQIGATYYALFHWHMVQEYRLVNGALSVQAAEITAREHTYAAEFLEAPLRAEN